MTELYPVVFRLDGRDRFVIWDGDGFLLDPAGRIASAGSLASLLEHPALSERTLQDEPPTVADLDALLVGLALGRVDPAGLNLAWNLLADADAACGGESFEERGDPKQKRLYDRLFWACNLPAMTPPGERFDPVWTRGEIRLLRRLLARGMRLLRARLPDPRGYAPSCSPSSLRLRHP